MTRWCQADYLEVNPSSRQGLASSLAYKGFMLNLFILYKSRMGICTRLDIITKESILDLSAYQEVKLDTKLITLLAPC
jgi:hypothetical protein